MDKHLLIFPVVHKIFHFWTKFAWVRSMSYLWEWLDIKCNIFNCSISKELEQGELVVVVCKVFNSIWCTAKFNITTHRRKWFYVYSNLMCRLQSCIEILPSSFIFIYSQQKIHKKKVYPCRNVCIVAGTYFLPSTSNMWVFFFLLSFFLCANTLVGAMCVFVLSSWDGLYFFDSHLCFYIIWMDETLNLVININVNEKVENRWIVPLIYGFFGFFFIYFSTENKVSISSLRHRQWMGYCRLWV